MFARRMLVLLVASFACTQVSEPTSELPASEVDAAPLGENPEAPADPASCQEDVDVVFVLDTSSSMSFVLQALEDEIAAVVDASNALAEGANFGLVVFQDNHVVDASSTLENPMAHTTAASLQAAFAYYREIYTDYDRNPGDGPTGPTLQNPLCEENSLDALFAAATEYPWRDNATRVIIVATDDTFLVTPDNYGDRDGDGDTTSTDFPAEGNYPAMHGLDETISTLVDARIRVFSFTKLDEPGFLDFGKCGTPRRLPWNQITAGWSQPYEGVEPIPAQTGGQNFDLDEVRDGALSLGETINQVVVDSYCAPPVE